MDFKIDTSLKFFKVACFRFISLMLFLLCSSLIFSQDVSILYDQEGELTLLDIPFEKFSPIESGYSNGLHRGIYWLQIESVNEISTFQLENNHIENVQVFQGFNELATSNHNGFTSFAFLPDLPVFVRLEIQKEAFFPFTLKSKQNYERFKIQEAVGLGMFYGFALVVFLLNIGLFVSTRDKAFLYYSIFLIFILAVFAHRDGFVEILGMSNAIKQITEPLCLAVGGLMCAIFTVKSLRLRFHYPFIAFSYWGAAVLSILFLSLYLALNDYAYIIGIYFICLYIFVSSWICSLFLIRIQRYAYIFCLAYFFMMITAILFYLGPALNLQIFEVKQIHLKISAFVEMIIITFAIVYRMKTLDRKQRKMRQEMNQYLSEIAFLSEELEKNQQGEENIFTKFNLTTRENEILEMISDGKGNKQIAEDLFISINTVKFHVKKIYEKLEVSNRKDASKIVQQKDLA